MERRNSRALEEWQQTVQQFIASKPRTNFQLIQRYAGVLASVLRDPTLDLREVLSSCMTFPSGVVGLALSSSCDTLSDDRRGVILEWISRQSGDRPEVERVYSLPGMLRSVPNGAFKLMSDMRISPPPTKEQRERLATALNDVDADTISALFNNGELDFKVRKVVSLLLTAAGEPKAERTARAAILEAVVAVAVKRRLFVGPDNIRPQVLRMLEQVPPTVSERIRSIMFPAQPGAREGSERRELNAPVDYDRTTVDAQSEKPAASADEPTPKVDFAASDRDTAQQITPTLQAGKGTGHNTAPTVVADSPEPLAWFDANIQMLAHARHFYLEAHRAAVHERSRREELELKLKDHAKTEANVVELQSSLAALQETIGQLTLDATSANQSLHEANAALEQERRRSQELRVSLEQLNEQSRRAEDDRSALRARIDEHAEKTLKDFRIALSDAVSPILKDLPSLEDPELNALAPNLLVKLRQIMSALASKEIEISAKGAAL